MPMQDSYLKDELFLRHSSSKIQDWSLKDELVLRCSPSEFIDGHCIISWICVFFLLIHVSFLMTMCFFQLYTKCAPTTPCKAQLGELHFCNKWWTSHFYKIKMRGLQQFSFINGGSCFFCNDHVFFSILYQVCSHHVKHNLVNFRFL